MPKLKAKRQPSPDDLQTIPGIGPSLARDLRDLGFREVAALKDADPEEMYQKLCALRHAHIDRCVLYAFRCAVYFVTTPAPAREPEKLKWWNWKDGKQGTSSPAWIIPSPH